MSADMTSHKGEQVTETESLIAAIYAAFNRRDPDGVFSRLSERVSWPKASEGGRVTGKQEIAAYWRRQWQEFDPHVEPVEVLDKGADGVHVRVHQVVKNLSGEVLSDSEVWHVYAIRDGLVERMDVDGADAQQVPLAAFSRR